ncbi:hypothetical protein PHLCEN_2v7680 [Hermanssonia centrifuga]|uniref:Uncharacterized protein n=1 Tax=Hermanssonia centrifuga TaxID=98765 RepID=A0A2R6NVT9_9APHY|nr:hypothetical protein PHLCEN_2v7680 [Hermanssonia centrifuga]
MSLQTSGPDSASVQHSKEGNLVVDGQFVQDLEEDDFPPPQKLTPEQEKKLYRKIDYRLMPILTLMYLCSFLDRGNAKLQGLTTQLNLTGNKYNIALMATSNHSLSWVSLKRASEASKIVLVWLSLE